MVRPISSRMRSRACLKRATISSGVAVGGTGTGVGAGAGCSRAAGATVGASLVTGAGVGGRGAGAASAAIFSLVRSAVSVLSLASTTGGTRAGAGAAGGAATASGGDGSSNTGAGLSGTAAAGVTVKGAGAGADAGVGGGALLAVVGELTALFAAGVHAFFSSVNENTNSTSPRENRVPSWRSSAGTRTPSTTTPLLLSWSTRRYLPRSRRIQACDAEMESLSTQRSLFLARPMVARSARRNRWVVSWN